MKYILIRTFAVLVTSYVTRVGVPVVFAMNAVWNTVWVALVVALILAIINHTIKPLIMIVSLPVTLITLGLFSFVINGFMILIASYIVPGFSIPSLLMAIYFSIVLSLVNWVLSLVD